MDKPKQQIPNIGEVVWFEGKKDHVCQRRIGDEQCVLWWGLANRRFALGDKWEPVE